MRLAVLIPILTAISLPALGQEPIDYFATYGTRDPVKCGPFTSIAGPALTAEEAQQIYVCSEEAEPLDFVSNLYLNEDVKFRVGASRPFGQADDYLISDIDQSKPVYPVRGTLTKVQCDDFSTLYPNQGKNCNEYEKTADGICYINLFGEWSCSISEMSTGRDRMGIAPRPAS